MWPVQWCDTGSVSTSYWETIKTLELLCDHCTQIECRSCQHPIRRQSGFCHWLDFITWRVWTPQQVTEFILCKYGKYSYGSLQSIGCPFGAMFQLSTKSQVPTAPIKKNSLRGQMSQCFKSILKLTYFFDFFLILYGSWHSVKYFVTTVLKTISLPSCPFDINIILWLIQQSSRNH